MLLSMIYSLTQAPQKNKVAKHPEDMGCFKDESRFLFTYISSMPVKSSFLSTCCIIQMTSQFIIHISFRSPWDIIWSCFSIYVFSWHHQVSVMFCFLFVRSPSSTGTFWSSLLFCGYSAKHSTILYKMPYLFIQKPHI